MRRVPSGGLICELISEEPAGNHAQAVALWEWGRMILARLPEQQRAVVDLRYRWGWTDEVIAEALNIAPSTVRVHAARGLAALRRMVRDASPPGPMSERLPGVSVGGPDTGETWQRRECGRIMRFPIT
jgi:Sigma-70, region 4